MLMWKNSVDKVLQASIYMAYREFKPCREAVLWLCRTLGKSVDKKASYQHASYQQISTRTCAKTSGTVIHRSYSHPSGIILFTKSLIYHHAHRIGMWITARPVGYNGCLFLPHRLSNSGDIRVSGTLAAVRRASAR